MTRPMPLLDLAFLLLDRPQTPSNVGALLLFDAPPGRPPAAAAGQVVRAYRKARPGSPFDSVPDLSVPVLPHWRPAPQLDARRLVLRERLAAPGTFDALCRHVARLHETPLERDQPLFRIHVIDGLASGQLAVYLKSHHAYWDGRYALDRVFGRLRREPGPVTAPFFTADGDAAAASDDTRPFDAGAGLRSLLNQAAAVRELLGRLSARTASGDAAPPANRPFAGPHTRFNEPVQSGRSVAAFSLPLDEMRDVASAVGGTLNDVALAIIDAGVERLLTALGEAPPQALVAMCPVSLRAPGDREATTKAATLFVPLAKPGARPLERLRQVVAQARAAKAEFRQLSHEAALDYALLAFGLWFASSSLGFGAVTRPVVNLTVSNVGGIDGERYLGRCRLRAAYPVSMLADPVGLNVTLLSVDGRMDFGIVASAAVLADAFELAEACQAAFAQLRRAARGAAARRRRAATASAP